MHQLKAFTCSLLLLTTPSLFVYPQDTSFTPHKRNLKEKLTESILSYDEIIHLFDELESEELEKKILFCRSREDRSS